MPAPSESPRSALRRFERDRARSGLVRPLTPRARARFASTLGRTFGKLKVTGYAGFKPRADRTGGAAVWSCLCQCGRHKQIHDNNLFVKEGATRGCGACPPRVLDRNLDEMSLRLLALGIECEGTIGVYRCTTTSVAGKRYPYHAARVTIGMSAAGAPLLEQVIAEIRMGKLHRQGRGDERTHASVQLQFNNDEAKHVTSLVEPFLVTKHRQAGLVAAFPWSGRGRKVAAEIVALRDVLARETKVWNATGPDAPPAPSAARRRAAWIRTIERLGQEQRDRLLARVIDFEGSVMVRRTISHGARGVSHEPGIEVRQVTRRTELVRVVQALAGAGTIRPIKRRYRPNESPIVAWRASGNDAVELAQRLAPHLVLKRRQAEAVARFPWRGRTPVRIPADEFAVRERLYDLVRRLNDRYRDLPGIES